MAFPLAPWHMWGNTVRLTTATVSAVPSLDPPTQTNQVARINYKRPENWRFFMGAKLISGTTNATGSDLRAYVFVELIIGVGRSNFITKQSPARIASLRLGFCKFSFTVPNGVTPGSQNDNIKYTTSVFSPPVDDNDPTSTRVIDHFVSEDIQCEAGLAYQGAAPNFEVTAEVSAYFAPNVHVRPDWYKEEGDMFLGHEIGGT